MITAVVTVYNEEKTIVPLLDALSSQTKKIDEIIIVDAFSSDVTVEKIKNFIKEKKAKNILLFRKKGNRSTGRNFGISKAKGDIILVTDAGCIPNKNWTQFISSAFKKNTDVVSGFYYPRAKTPFKQALAAYTCVMPDRLNPREFLPSSRSVGFKKSAWEKVGGYPENLDTCEDLVFARNLKKAGVKFIFEKRAYVVWPQEENIISAFRQLYGYAKGDGQALYIRQQTPFLYGRYGVGMVLLILALVNKSYYLVLFLILALAGYLVWSIFKNQKYVTSSMKFFYLPLLQIVSDIAVIFGMTAGVFSRK